MLKKNAFLKFGEAIFKKSCRPSGIMSIRVFHRNIADYIEISVDTPP
jgi:hypothetical protein